MGKVSTWIKDRNPFRRKLADDVTTDLINWLLQELAQRRELCALELTKELAAKEVQDGQRDRLDQGPKSFPTQAR